MCWNTFYSIIAFSDEYNNEFPKEYQIKPFK